MTSTRIFLVGITSTVVVSFAAVTYLRPHLKRILTDLCGTEGRASFWTAFSNLTLVLVPRIFAMQYRPEIGPETSAALEIGALLKWALIGLVTSVLTLGIVLSIFIPRHPMPPADHRSAQPHAANS